MSAGAAGYYGIGIWPQGPPQRARFSNKKGRTALLVEPTCGELEFKHLLSDVLQVDANAGIGPLARVEKSEQGFANSALFIVACDLLPCAIGHIENVNRFFAEGCNMRG
jgi:hypothetical protein